MGSLRESAPTWQTAQYGNASGAAFAFTAASGLHAQGREISRASTLEERDERWRINRAVAARNKTNRVSRGVKNIREFGQDRRQSKKSAAKPVRGSAWWARAAANKNGCTSPR
jgi:hypothetical protein